MQSVSWCSLCRQMEKWRCAQSSSGGKEARDLCPLSLLLLLLLGVKLLSPVSAKRGHISCSTRVLLTRVTLKQVRSHSEELLLPSDEDTATSTKHYFFFQQHLGKNLQTHISATLVLLFFHVEKPFEYQCLGWRGCMRKLVLLQPAWYSFQTRLCSLWSQLQSSRGLTEV